MKAVALALVTVGVGAIGAKELLSSDALNSRSMADPATASAGETETCWSPEKIKQDRYTLRGAEGSIRSFEIDNVEGCIFRVKLEYTSPTGANKVLDYNAAFAKGDSPTFVTYNSPP